MAFTIKSRNPATLEIVGEVPRTRPSDVEKIVSKAYKGFPQWRDMGLEKRAEKLQRVQQLLLDRQDEIAETITLEMGRPLVESLAIELMGSADTIGYYTRRAEKFLGTQRVPLHNLIFMHRKNHFHYQALGVLGIISPWNWPILIPMGGIIPALLAGNAVVFKHSEQTPLTSEKIRALFLDAGVPEPVFQIVHGMADTGKALVDSGVVKIFFTGSTEVGQKVMAQAAKSLKKVVLELGGSDAAIVCGDADLEYTTSGILWGGFSNCGQNCNAVERVFVHQSVLNPFVEMLAEKVKRIRVGPGMDLETDMGPLSSAEQLKKIQNVVKHAKKKGGRVILGGKRIDRKGYFFEPTLVIWDKEKQPMDEELFGPILYITPVRDDEEAVLWANRSSFGLSASVWTGDPKRGRAIAHRLETGSVMINDAIVSFGMTEANWTGIKKSGIGWVHGKKGLDEMVNIQFVDEEPKNRQQKLWWFPYHGSTIDSLRAGMTFLYDESLKKKMKAVPGVIRSFTGYLLLNRRRKDKI